MRSLQDIYISCDFALLAAEPPCFDDAIENEEWKQDMQDEISAISMLREVCRNIKPGFLWKDMHNSKLYILLWNFLTGSKSGNCTVLASAAQFGWLVYQFEVNLHFKMENCLMMCCVCWAATMIWDWSKREESLKTQESSLWMLVSI